MLGNTVRRILLAVVYLSFTEVLLAGELDDFERSIKTGSVTQNSEYDSEQGAHKGQAGEKSNCSKNDLNFSCLLFHLLLDSAGWLISVGGQTSSQRIGIEPGENQDSQSLDVPVNTYSPSFYRQPGEPLIPFARLDFDVHRPSAALSARNLRLEAGRGAVAAGFDYSRFRETSEDDTLEISRIYGLFRMSFGSYVEADFGIGSMKVEGKNTKSLFYVTTPVLLHASEKVGFEFRPAWASNLFSNDLSLMVKADFASLKLGYKKLSTDTQTLKGPYAGIALYY